MRLFADNKLDITQMMGFSCDKTKQYWKRRRCWLQALSSFPTMFSAVVFFRVDKCGDFVVRVDTNLSLR